MRHGAMAELVAEDLVAKWILDGESDDKAAEV
jgi:hypothetical protein